MRRLRRRVQRVGHLRGACARPATRFQLVVGHLPEGGDSTPRSDGQEPSSFTVRLRARLPFDKRPESWLDDPRSAGEKCEPRSGEGPQPMEECATALRVGFDGRLGILGARAAHAKCIIKFLLNAQVNLSASTL